MIFSSKQRGNARRRSPTMESCVSILGLFSVCGLIGGLGSLIYGLVKGNSTGTIGGGVVLGVSATFIVILLLIIIFCFKNNPVDSNTNDQQLPTHNYQYKRNHHQKHIEIPIQEITVVSGNQTYDPQKQQNRYDKNIHSSLVSTDKLPDRTNKTYGKQISSLSRKISSIDYLNESNHSIHSQNHYSFNHIDKS